MAPSRSDDESLFATTWVHVFEQDTPRERLVLTRDGSARILAPGPDDRFVEQHATWSKEGDTVIVRANKGNLQLRVAQKAPDILIVQTRREGAPG